MTDLKPGDRVHVTINFEGTVTHDGQTVVPNQDNFDLPSFDIGGLERFEGATVEKLARPFKPGDLVRPISGSENSYYLLGETHYHSFTRHGSKIWEYGLKTNTIAEAFPTNLYELVEVG